MNNEGGMGNVEWRAFTAFTILVVATEDNYGLFS
jgi:hypothetical protein